MPRGQAWGDHAARGVLLASLPLSSPRYPSMALGLLKPAIEAIGVRCDVRYFSIDYIDAVGRDVFAALSDMHYYTALVGEWVFAQAARGDDTAAPGTPDDLDYLADVFAPKCPAKDAPARMLALLAAREGAAGFVARCVDSVDWRRIGVLGISTSFQQNMASLAFARLVRARHPHVAIVFGGANCQGEMGVELHRRYDFIDAVCLGEGDRTFPQLVGRLLAGEDAGDLPGFTRRDAAGASRAPAQEVDQIDDLDSLPYPDFSDFDGQRAASVVAAGVTPTVMFETARGCWWGAKHHCTFCGLNGRMMSYRSKSPERARAELDYLTARHTGDVVSTDAILDTRYFDEFLPRLAADGPRVRLFWQMKANLKPEQLDVLAAAGVRRIQPGIEALDTSLLTLMRKGCTMLQNVQLLKLAAERGISVAWNLLYGFPGEDPEAYARSAALIPKLLHLQPPTSTGRVLADRFSPYFQAPASFGVTLTPAAAYRFLYPFGDESVRAFAYHFHMHAPALERIGATVAALRARQREWSEHWTTSALYGVDQDDGVLVTDRRWGWPDSVTLFTEAAAAILRLSWRATPWHALVRANDGRFTEAALKDALARLDAAGLLVKEGHEYLSLVLRQPGPRRAPTWREILAGDRTTQPATADAAA